MSADKVVRTATMAFGYVEDTFWPVDHSDGEWGRMQWRMRYGTGRDLAAASFLAAYAALCDPNQSLKDATAKLRRAREAHRLTGLPAPAVQGTTPAEPRWGVCFKPWIAEPYTTPWPAGKEHAESVVRRNAGAVLIERPAAGWASINPPRSIRDGISLDTPPDAAAAIVAAVEAAKRRLSEEQT